MSNEWRFEWSEFIEPTSRRGYIRGVARRDKKSTMFCVAGDKSVAVFLLAEPTQTGLDLVRLFERRLGPATLLYMFDCDKHWLNGYWAEWYFHADNEALNHRIDELKQGKITRELPKGRVTFLPRRSNYVV